MSQEFEKVSILKDANVTYSSQSGPTVPTAGEDVEVLVRTSNEAPFSLTQIGHLGWGMELVDRAHVTLLQAEVERLKDNVRWKTVADQQMQVIAVRKFELTKALSEVQRYKTMSDNYCALGMDANTELTKARELLSKQEDFISAAWQWLPIWLRKTYKRIAQQSAPAANGESQ